MSIRNQRRHQSKKILNCHLSVASCELSCEPQVVSFLLSLSKLSKMKVALLQALHLVSLFIKISSLRSFPYDRKFKVIPKLSAMSNDDDDELYQSLEKAKLRLGGEIPPEQAAAEAESAENDFLQAMRQVSKRFEQDKERLGADGAIDRIKDQWDQEERLREALENEEEKGEFE